MSSPEEDSELSFDSDELGLPTDLGLSKDVFELYCNPAAESDQQAESDEAMDTVTLLRSVCVNGDVHSFIRELSEVVQTHEHGWFVTSLPGVLDAHTDPVDFVLRVLSNQSPKLRRKASRVSSGTIDLPLLVANSLGTLLISKGALSKSLACETSLSRAVSRRHDIGSTDGCSAAVHSSAPSGNGALLDLLNEQHVRRARDIVCRPFLPPRTALALLRSCGVDIRSPSLVKRLVRLVRELLEDGEHAQASYWISRFMLFDEFSNEEFLLPLIKRKGRGMQSLLDYVESFEESTPADSANSSMSQPVLTGRPTSSVYVQLTELRRRTQYYIIQHVAESGEGNSPNAALKLIKRWSLRYEDFPRVIYLNKKNILWWSAKAGKTREFADLICGDDHRLQLYVCRQLRKDRSQYEDFFYFIEKYGLTAQTEFRTTYGRWKSNPPLLTGDRDGADDSDEGLPQVPPRLEAHLSSTNQNSAARRRAQVRDQRSEQKVDGFTKVISIHHRSGNAPHLSIVGETLPLVRQRSVKLGLDGEVMRDADDAASSEDSACADRPSSRRNAELESSEQPYLDMDHAMLVFVDTKRGVEAALDILMDKDSKLIGLDNERMPDNLKLFHGLPVHCQTLQIATRYRTFVFDLSKLRELPSMELCFRHVFEREDSVKVGMGFAGDMAALRDEFPDALCFTSTLPQYLELEEVLRHIPRDRSSHRSVSSSSRRKVRAKRGGHRKKRGQKRLSGLARLVFFCLGKHLNKFEQLSNWSRRPLRASQLLYAGLDAYCEILVYDKLEILSDAMQIPLLRDFLDDLVPT